MPEAEPDELAYAFAFFEEVHVPDASPEQLGAVLGRSRSESGEESYAVALDGQEEVEIFSGSQLRPTGRVRRSEDYYDGTVLRVTPGGRVL